MHDGEATGKRTCVTVNRNWQRERRGVPRAMGIGCIPDREDKRRYQAGLMVASSAKNRVGEHGVERARMTKLEARVV